MKQVTQYNKVVSHIAEMVSKTREEWEIESSARSGMYNFLCFSEPDTILKPITVGVQQTSSMTDTQALVAAVGMGKGLKVTMPVSVPGSAPSGGLMVPPTIRPPTQMSSVSPSGVNPLGKAPSSIKTNIKSASQIHPFNQR